jgi:hypothetical protein
LKGVDIVSLHDDGGAPSAAHVGNATPLAAARHRLL